MENSGKKIESYKDAGVHLDEGARFVRLIADAVKKTHNNSTMADFGGFAGLYDISFLKNYQNPVLVSGTDGVGTKLRLASLFNRHETVGIDLVAMCSNDILVTGGKPLFFLDYIACGRLNADQMKKVVESICEGCLQAGAVLLGGETAEHPDLIHQSDYDLAGFMVGIVEKNEIINGESIEAGNVIIGLPSSGVHSNGFSLIRRLFLKEGLHLPESSADRDFLLNEILVPTIIYETMVRHLLEKKEPILGMAHITGGGFYENIPRILPDGLKAIINRTSIDPPALFKRIQERGAINENEMYRVFNMGIGYVLITTADAASGLLSHLEKQMAKTELSFSNRHPRIIGTIVGTNEKEQLELI